jgi:hypothetical protein
MKKNYLKPAIELTDCCTDDCLLLGSVTEVTAEGLSDDNPVEQILGIGSDGLPYSFPILGGW